MAARHRGRGRAAAHPRPPCPARDGVAHRAGDHGVRWQRAGHAAAAAAEPALAQRRGRHGRLDRRPARRPARGGRRGRRGGRRGVHGPRPRHRARHRAGLPARPVAGRGRRLRGPGGLRDERRSAARPARLPGAGGGPGLVRHGQRQVAVPDHGGHRVLRRLPEPGLPAPAGDRRGGRAGHPHRAPGAAPATGLPRLHDAHPRRTTRSHGPAGPRLVWLGARSSAWR